MDAEEDPFSPKTLEPKIEKSEEIIQNPQNSRLHHKKTLIFKEKEFKIRPSLLTTFFDGNAGIVFNIFVALFLLLTLGTWTKDLLYHKNPLYHCWLILWNFEKLPIVLLFWCGMFGSTIIFPYAGLKLWAHIASKRVTIYTEILYLVGYVGYLVSLFYFPLKFLFYMKLNSACSFIITCENTRLIMKVHGFVRENIPRGIQQKLDLSHGILQVNPGHPHQWPTVEQFIYYMFCPSFLYRDEYPKTSTRDWSLVVKYFIQCLTCIYFTNLIVINFIYPTFEPVDYKTVSWKFLVYSLFPSIIPGGVCLILLFYGLLHIWLNMFSEAMFFGDRLFYANWWSSKNMAEYYRNWNLVVHEWLYAYVYRDVSNLIGGKRGRAIAQIIVFFLSAAFHEYWFGVALRMFYPIMFVLYFILGGMFFTVSHMIREPYIWNIAMWFNLLIGTGMFISCYATEWYARQRCPSIFDNQFIDLLVPRVWTC